MAGELPGTVTLSNAGDILDLVASDAWMMRVLATARALDLPDWWIGAGFVRAKVWDALHDRNARTALDDIDVLYFDPDNPDPARDAEHEARLSRALPGIPWSVKNQARMHLRNGDPAYRDTEDAMRHWLETATCVGVSLDGQDRLHLIAPYGLDDLFALRLRPTPAGRRRLDAYRHRLDSKGWARRWPLLKVERD